MYHDQDAGAPAFLRPLSIDVATLGQPDAPSLKSPRSHVNGEDVHRHRDDGQGFGNFQVSVPGGASVLMQDSAGTSMSLNLGIDPRYGTPILSGRAIDAHGGVLDVHPCSCNDPISPRHKLPGSPEHFRGGAHLRDHSHLYPSPKSPFGANRRLPVSTPTPLIVVQTQQTLLPPSPSHPDLQVSELEAPVPETSIDPLRSPFTPTPASMRQHSQSSSNDSHDTFYTPPLVPEDSSKPHKTVLPAESSPSGKVALKLDTIPEQSLYDPDLDTPLVQSPASEGACSDISGPSALGPLFSLPSTPTPSSVASECSTRTVIPHSYPVQDVQLDFEEQLNTESTNNDPLLRVNAFSQGSSVSTAADSALPGPSGGPIHLANVDTLRLGHDGLTSIADAHVTSRQGSVVDSVSDLYTDRVIADPLPSMPVPRIGPDGQELRFNLAVRPHSDRAQELTNPPVIRSGNLEGKWVANLQQDKMALKLDLSLDGLGMHNLSLSLPPNFPLSSDQAAAPEVRHGSPQLWEPLVAQERVDRWEVESEKSVVTIGSCPSIAPPLSDLPLTPIPELLHTPTRHSMFATGASVSERPSPRSSALLSERQHPQSKLPGPLDSGPILEQLTYGEGKVGTIRSALRSISREWQNIVVMPGEIALCDIDDACGTLYHALTDLAPIITLTWPLARQPSLGTEGGQPPTAEFQHQLQHMSDAERKWYLKQHEFTTSLQRNLTRLALLAQRVREDPVAACKGNVYERISQFAAKFQDIALRLRLAHHIRVEQKYRVRVRHTARRAVASPEQVAAHEYNKARLIKVREEIEGIKRTLLSLCDDQSLF